MVYPAASTVPVPELIRRGYDRAKGLGHEGIDAVKAEMREMLAECVGGELSAPVEVGSASLIVHPSVMAAAYAPEAPDGAVGAMVAAFEPEVTLVITHPLLRHAIERFQADGKDVRMVTRWIAAMTVLPKWAAPGAAPDGASDLQGADRAMAEAVAGALTEGPVCAVVVGEALGQALAGLEGLTLIAPLP